MKKEEIAEKMKKGEREAVREYGKAIHKTKGKERKTFKHILPDEKEHLKELKKI